MIVAQRANTLLTGTPGVGKTTLIRSVLGRISVRAGGFFTGEIRERGQRVGFAIQSLSGDEGILAHVALRSGPKVGRYKVNVPDIERVGIRALEDALNEAELIVCDEIGRMEMYCPAFCELLEKCLDAPKPVLGTIQARRHEFLDRIRQRRDVDLVVVTVNNRNLLVDELAGRLGSILTA